MQIDFRRGWAQTRRVCRLGVRLLTNLGSGDFLVILESLVFSCLGIIRWWRDIMVDSWSYLCWVLQMPPLPLTSRPCPKLSPRAFPFCELPLPVPTGCHLCFTHHFLTSTATQHFSPIYVLNIRAGDNVWQTHVVWSCLIPHMASSAPHIQDDLSLHTRRPWRTSGFFQLSAKYESKYSRTIVVWGII